MHKIGDRFVIRKYSHLLNDVNNEHYDDEFDWRIYTLCMWNPLSNPDVGTSSILVDIENGKPFTNGPWNSANLLNSLTDFDLYTTMGGGVAFNPTAVYKIYKIVNDDVTNILKKENIGKKTKIEEDGIIQLSFLSIHEELMRMSNNKTNKMKTNKMKTKSIRVDPNIIKHWDVNTTANMGEDSRSIFITQPSDVAGPTFDPIDVIEKIESFFDNRAVRGEAEYDFKYELYPTMLSKIREIENMCKFIEEKYKEAGWNSVTCFINTIDNPYIRIVFVV